MQRPDLVEKELNASALSLLSGVETDSNERMRELDKSICTRQSCSLGFVPDKFQENVGKVTKHLYRIC
jgi:hypothetical protein